MAAAVEWCSDFCLACDKQTSGDAYCSQACRLAELDRSASASEPSSPSTSSPMQWPGRLHLPIPYDFAYRKASPPVSSRKIDFTNPFQSTYSPSQSQRTLTTSSSQTSLSSMHSNASQTTLSDRARTELREYANSFDQTRDWKRRANST